MDLLGKPVSDKILKDAKSESDNLKQRGIIPTIAVVRVGENKSDIAYENSIKRLMDRAGIEISSVVLAEDILKDSFIEEIEKLNNNDNIHGILVFRPLPRGLDEDELKYIISPKKDVDAFSPENLCKIFMSDNSGLAPCTPAAVMEILDYYGVELEGKEVVLIGRSLVVGKPLAMMLLDKNTTLTICHSRTQNLPAVASKGDVLIAAIGRGNMIDESYVKSGAVVVDVGINFEDGKMVGDVDYENVKDKASMITPVPGGIGIVTTSLLAKNTIKAILNGLK